ATLTDVSNPAVTGALQLVRLDPAPATTADVRARGARRCAAATRLCHHDRHVARCHLGTFALALGGKGGMLAPPVGGGPLQAARLAPEAPRDRVRAVMLQRRPAVRWQTPLALRRRRPSSAIQPRRAALVLANSASQCLPAPRATPPLHGP